MDDPHVMLVKAVHAERLEQAQRHRAARAEADRRRAARLVVRAERLRRRAARLDVARLRAVAEHA